ncbi:MAG: hypothetical protein JWP46_4403 [Modestobacter sp.]|nr:hypothetical protein [Modestobacter sp.]
MDSSPGAVTQRLWPLLVSVHDALRAGVAVSAAVHAAHGWNPTADRHLDHQLVRREAMEHLRPWGADLDDPRELPVPVPGLDPRHGRQQELTDTGPENLGLPMSGLILGTPTDVVRVWHSEDGELPAADTPGLRAFYRQTPSTQTQLVLDDGRAGTDSPRCHLALLWADTGAVVTRLDLVRPYGCAGRRAQVDWHVDLLPGLAPGGRSRHTGIGAPVPTVPTGRRPDAS